MMEINELAKEMKKYGYTVNNQTRLASLSSKKFAAEIREKFIENPLGKYIDLEAWLKSPDPEPVYIGTDAMYLVRGKLLPCKIISVSKQLGNEYADIIDVENKRILNVPKGRITDA